MSSSLSPGRPVTKPAHSGRRPGKSGTRELIASVAGRQFAELGYDRTTMRGIAREANVDPALVKHYFGTKPELFVSVVQLPFDPAVVAAGVFAGDRDTIGERLANFVLAVLESEEGRRRLTGIVRAAASEPEAARLVRERIVSQILGALAESIGADDPQLRASLVSSQVVGLIMTRYVIGVEPLASRDAASIVAALAPVLQHYLVEPL